MAARETIMAALAAKLFAVADFKTASRRHVFWNDVSAFPACFVRLVRQTTLRGGTILRQRTLDVEVWVYTDGGADPDAVPETALNDIVDAVDDALAPDNLALGTLTLGGLVQHCWHDGQIEQDPGDRDGIAKAVIDVKILLP